MKKYLHIALMLLCVFVVSSCKDETMILKLLKERLISWNRTLPSRQK